MHLEFSRDERRQLPEVEEPHLVRTARMWHCKFRTLAEICQFSNLEGLEIATWPDVSFNALESLVGLKYLRVLHLPKVSSVAPIANLRNLEVLRLATLPSWDASGKTTELDSLEPLVNLARLRHIEMFGVRALDRSLAPLESCATLVSARFSKWPMHEVQRFFAQTGLPDEWAPNAWF